MKSVICHLRSKNMEIETLKTNACAYAAFIMYRPGLYNRKTNLPPAEHNRNVCAYVLGELSQDLCEYDVWIWETKRSQSGFLSVLVFSQTRETSSVTAQVLYQFKVHTSSQVQSK